MMKERENIKMEINIAGERMTLTVPFSRQNAVRDSERRVGDLFKTWSERYPNKKPKEILAMVAYQFATFYGDLMDDIQNALEVADEIDDKLTRMLANKNHIEKPTSEFNDLDSFFEP